MNIVLLGPPGAGKGTQAQFIVKNYNYFQLSTGDLLRKEINKKTDLGKKIESLISKGKFVPDDLVENILKNTIDSLDNKEKIIFDGYPRNINQAHNLENIMKELGQKIDAVIYLNVNREVIHMRIMGRMTCLKCNVTLNEFFNKEEINNHECGKKNLRRRDDDQEEVIMKRFDTYINETKPVLNFYTNHGNFYELDGTLKMEEISNKIANILNG